MAERMARPIFVLGASASGAEFMRLCLDGHPNIAIGPETAIMRLVKAHRFMPYWRFGKRWWERLDLTEEELNRALRDFYGGFFERLARRDGKRRWGDRTPLHVWHMDEIVKVFDDAMLVAVVRHPGASIASLVERFGFGVELATTTWLRMNQVLAHDGAAMGDRLMLTRYEDLAREPEPVLRELLVARGALVAGRSPGSRGARIEVDDGLTEDARVGSARRRRAGRGSSAARRAYAHGVTRAGVVAEALPPDRRRARGAPPRVRRPVGSAPPPEAARGNLQAAAAEVCDPREGHGILGSARERSRPPSGKPPVGSGAACARSRSPGGPLRSRPSCPRRQSREPDQTPGHRILEERRVEERVDEDRGQPERSHQRREANGLVGGPPRRRRRWRARPSASRTGGARRRPSPRAR